jgi:hypothetical protein
VLAGGEPTLWLRRAEFTIPLLIASSALFFIPGRSGEEGADEVFALSPARLGRAPARARFAPSLADALADSAAHDGALAWHYPIL